jgi:hypothetical protein
MNFRIVMPRCHRDTGTSHMSCQRQLRVGQRVRLATVAFTTTLVMLSPAVAEVCDKAVGESWQPKDGPIWLLNPVGMPIAFIFLICGLVIVATTRLWWLGYVGSALLVANALALVFFDLIPEHEIYLAQIREGCRSYRTDLVNVGLMTIFAVAYGWLGHRAKRRPANA